MCGVCHSGIEVQSASSSFGFEPGDSLKVLPGYNTYNGGTPDVHGNQMQLLKASPCYLVGKAECVSCHDIHDEKQQSLALYSNKCMSCHQSDAHPTVKGQDKAVLANNCIDCHMPEITSTAIGFQKNNSKDKFPYQVRTHRIAIYEDVIK
jgi:hypothetical protein